MNPEIIYTVSIVGLIAVIIAILYFGIKQIKYLSKDEEKSARPARRNKFEPHLKH